MSKPSSVSKGNNPYDPQPRKSSQPGPNPKFYDGPTVAAKTEQAKDKAKVAVNKTAAGAQIQARRGAAVVRRHPWSFLSILTALPFLLTISLFSTVVCPPPTSKPSTISRLVLAPLGLHESSSQHSELHQTLCYPANVYHREVLQPYIYPVIENIQDKAASHPIYKSGIQPAYALVETCTKRVWEGPIRPVVDRATRGARRVFLTFIQPHIPFLTNKASAITAPYTARVSALHQSYIEPHLTIAQQYAQAAGKQSVDAYNYVFTHPLTGQTAKYAGHGYRLSRDKSHQAYEWSRPHAIRAGRGADYITRKVVGPRVVGAASWGAEQTEKGWSVIRLHVSRAYYAYIHPHVGPYLNKADALLSPYVQTFQTRVYRPYIFPVLERFLPRAILAPEPPKSFWALMAEILPSLGGGHVAEHKGQMDDFYENIDKSKKPAKVPVPGAEKVAKAESAHDDDKAAKKMDRAEMDRVREAIKERVEKQGQRGYEQVRSELLELHTNIISDPKLFPALSSNAVTEIEREVTYLMKGLDKLYTTSTTLTREQVGQSSSQADARVAKKVVGVKERVKKMKDKWHNDGKSVARKGLVVADAALGTEWTDLANKMSWMDGVTTKDWAKYNTLKEAVDAWGEIYIALHKGQSKDRQLNEPSANIEQAIATLNTELDDMMEGFRDRVQVLKRTALDRIEARQELAAEGSSKPVQSKVNSYETKSKSTTEDSKATVLPIVEAGAAAAAAGGFIGKGRDQVIDALNQASAAVVGETTPAGVIDQAKSVVSSVYDAASSGAHDATRSVMSAVGATPSPESVGELAESVINAAGDKAQVVYDAASSVVHDATRTAMSVVGATPSSDSRGEHVESVINRVKGSGNAAQNAAGSMASGASEQLEDILGNVHRGYAAANEAVRDQVHDAARAGMKAVGVSPSPEGVAEHAESIASVVSASVSSVASQVSGSAESAAAAAGSAIHDGTRSVVMAVGATPSPESPREHAESIVDGAASVYNDAASQASSAYEAAAGAVITDQATSLASQIQSALGLISTSPPLASSASSYLSSLSNAGATALPDLLSSGSSILASLETEASASIHSATRAAGRAAGVEPTETPGEYVDEAAESMKEARRAAVSILAKYAGEATRQMAKASDDGARKAASKDEL